MGGFKGRDKRGEMKGGIKRKNLEVIEGGQVGKGTGKRDRVEEKKRNLKWRRAEKRCKRRKWARLQGKKGAPGPVQRKGRLNSW